MIVPGCHMLIAVEMMNSWLIKPLITGTENIQCLQHMTLGLVYNTFPLVYCTDIRKMNSRAISIISHDNSKNDRIKNNFRKAVDTVSCKFTMFDSTVFCTGVNCGLHSVSLN